MGGKEGHLQARRPRELRGPQEARNLPNLQVLSVKSGGQNFWGLILKPPEWKEIIVVLPFVHGFTFHGSSYLQSTVVPT